MRKSDKESLLNLHAGTYPSDWSEWLFLIVASFIALVALIVYPIWFPIYWLIKKI